MAYLLEVEEAELDFLAALNVTIYGLGIVFLALLILMFTIMVLTKLFSVVTGNNLMEAPNHEAPAKPEVEPVTVPEASQAEAGRQAISAAPMAAPAVLHLTFGGETHRAEIRDVTPTSATVVLDGVTYKVERDRVDVKTVTVNGRSHTLEVKDVTDRTATVVIDGATQTVEITREKPAAAPMTTTRVVKRKRVVSGALETVTAPLPGKILSVAVKPGDAVKVGDELCVIEAMKMGNSIKAQRDGTVKEVAVSPGQTVGFGATLLVLATGDVVEEEVEEVVEEAAAPAKAQEPQPAVVTISSDGKQYVAEVRPGAGDSATINVGGSTFQVTRDPGDASRVTVNGQPHTVEIKEITESSATVVIDGAERRIGLARTAVPAATPSPAPARPPAAPEPPKVAAAPQPSPAPSSVAAAHTRPTAGGEKVTAPLPGKILSVAVQPGDRVSKGDELCVIEAMKMGNSIKAQRAGTIVSVMVSPGQTVGFGATLFIIE